MSFYIQGSNCRHQYGCIDTSNTYICPQVIILWHNILEKQFVALNSLLTTLPNRNIYSKRMTDIDYIVIYCSVVQYSALGHSSSGGS